MVKSADTSAPRTILAFEEHMRFIQPLGSFMVDLISRKEHIADVGTHRTISRVYDQILRPLLSIAEHAYVYGVGNESPILRQCSAILRRTKGKHELDLSEEIIRGKEVLWNADYPHRGAILILVPESKFSPELFREAKSCHALTNPRSRAYGCMGAYNTAKKMATKGYVALLLGRGSVTCIQIFIDPTRIRDEFHKFCQALNPGLLTAYLKEWRH